jgi:hypothetical protein
LRSFVETAALAEKPGKGRLPRRFFPGTEFRVLGGGVGGI